MKKISSIVFMLMALIIISISCAQNTGDLKEIRIADGKGDWGMPSPFLHYPRGPGYLRMSWAFDTLVWKNDSGYIPALAQKWEYIKKENAFVFVLNEKAKWHDGKPVTSGDVKFTIEYFKKHPYRWINLGSVGKVITDGKRKVKIYLTKNYSPFLSDVAGTMPVMPEHIWKNIKEPSKFTDKRAITGSGPYRFVDFNRTKGTYLYEAFNDYYGGKPAAQRLIYIKGSPVMSLLTDRADLANIKPKMAKKLKAKGMVLLTDTYGWNKKLMINHRKAPFKMKKFRQALAFAINRQEIIDKAHQGFGKPASFGLLSSDHECYNRETPDYKFSINKSGELLKSLGYKMGKDGHYLKNGKPLKIRLLSSNISVAGEKSNDRDGEVIRNQLEKAGIKTELVNLEQAVLDIKVKSWNFDLAISGHGGIMGDPKILNEMISSKFGAGSVNSARYDANPKLNRLLTKQLLEMDKGKRKKIVQEIQKVYAQDLPAISLYYPLNMSAYNPKKGIKWFYTKGGICKGIPISQNKMSLVSGK